MEMKLKMLALPLLAAGLMACTSSGTEPEADTYVEEMPQEVIRGQLAKGATMVTTTNLHIDPTRRVLYAMNYQLPTLMPVCSEVTIKDFNAKVVVFDYQGTQYKYMWDRHTRGAGQSLAENFAQYFGADCDQAKIDSMSKVDREGIQSGRAKLGMTKEGVLIAMGRPPIHANPSLDNSTWTYWKNKWVTKLINFDDSGKVSEIIE